MYSVSKGVTEQSALVKQMVKRVLTERKTKKLRAFNRKGCLKMKLIRLTTILRQ